MNPADAYRKELRKKELKRNKKERKKVREVRLLKKDLEALREQIEKLERMKADGTLDKARKRKKRQLEDTLNLVLKKRKVTSVLPPPPPPSGLPPKVEMQQSDSISSEFVPNNAPSSNNNSTPLVPPPPRQPSPLVVHRIPLMNPLQNGMIPPGIVCFSSPDMMLPVLVSGISSKPPPPLPRPLPGIIPPPIPQPVFVAPPGPPPFPRPLFRPGLPIPQEDLEALRPSAPRKPSYIKSAASTVVKRPLAQHNPELTAMVPASVRVRREIAATKVKQKSLPFMASMSKPSTPAAAPKPCSVDDSYTAFLKDMKALGALDG